MLANSLQRKAALSKGRGVNLTPRPLGEVIQAFLVVSRL